MRRLYRAVCAWIEADTQTKLQPEPELHAEGNNFAQAEHAHSYTTPPEMHSGWGRQSMDDNDGGTYRLGFQKADRP
jgi:hypothetical protein